MATGKGANKKVGKTEHKKMTKGQQMVEQMRGKATIKMTTDEILSITRGRR